MDYEAFTRALKDEIRTNGRPTSGFFEDKPVMVLSTRGAKTGENREAVLAYTREGDRYVVVASKSGAPTNPAWYHNLKANSESTVEADRERFTVRATEVTGAERDRLYAQHAVDHPQFLDYPSKTSRVIPVMELERVDPA